MVIYIDVLFLVNMGMDIAVILLAGKLLHKRLRLIRYFMAASLGAAIALLALVPFIRQSQIAVFLCNIGGCMSMAAVAYREKRIKGMLKDSAALYVVTFFLGGAVQALYSYTEFGYFIRIKPMQGSLLVICACLACVFFGMSFHAYQKWEREERLTYQIVLEKNGNRIQTTAFMDTGNSLCDPVQRKPVIVVDMELIQKLFDEEFCAGVKMGYESSIYSIPEGMKGVFLIPYRTVAESGLLFGVRIDAAYIGRGGTCIKLRKPCLAISREAIKRGKVRALLQPDHIKEQEDESIQKKPTAYRESELPG